MGEKGTQEKSTSTKSFEDYIYKGGEEHHEPDALHREFQSGGAERTERQTGTSTEGQVDWRKELETASKGLVELARLEKSGINDSNREQARQLVDAVDMSFQKALPYLRENATQADAAVFGKAMQFQNIQQDREQIYAELGIPKGTKVEGDQLANAILNAPNDAVRNKLTQLETLNELERATVGQTAENLNVRALPYVAGLKYAEFLEKWRPNGITASYDNPTNVYSSLDVLRTVNSAEMQAAGGRDAITRAGDKQADNANQVIPAEKNPLLYLQQAMQMQDPKEALAAVQKAAQLADGINPDDCKKKIEELKGQMAGADPTKQQELQQQIAAWDSLSHAGGLSNTMLGRMLLTQQPPDFDGAKAALLKASKDAAGANMMIDERGNPMYTTLMMVALTKGDQSMVQKIEGVGKAAQDAQQKAAEAEKEQDEDKKKQLLDEATRLGEKAIQESKVLTQAFGGKNGQDLQKQIDELTKKPENQRSEEEKFQLAFLQQVKGLGDLEASTMASVASWDMAKGDGHAAKALLEDLEKNHPEFFAGKDDTFKNQFKELKDGAASLAEDQDIDSKAWYNPMKYVEKAWKFCKDNAKWIAFGVAVVGAAAVTIATAGAGAPVGLAILAGAGAGLVGGTVVGTGLELASGREKNVLSAAWKVAPYAAAGGAAGALGAYYFAPAGLAALGGEAATTTLGVASGSGFLGTMGAGAVTGTASGAFWNFGKVRDGMAVGKYDGFGEAATDWATGTAAWGVNGAMAGFPIKWGFQGAAALGAGGLSRGAMIWGGSKVAFNAGVGYMQMPGLSEIPQQYANAKIAAWTGHTPRWMGQAAGYSSEEVRMLNEQEAARRNGEVQEEQPQVQEQQQAERRSDANQVQPVETTQPSTYQPGKISYDDYLK